MASAPVPLRRQRRERMIAGVLAGFARHYDLDLALLRVVYAVATIFTAFFGVVVYLMCWVVIPEEHDGDAPTHAHQPPPAAGGDPTVERRKVPTVDGKPLDL